VNPIRRARLFFQQLRPVPRQIAQFALPGTSFAPDSGITHIPRG
jgi:hypothetical protein